MDGNRTFLKWHDKSFIPKVNKFKKETEFKCMFCLRCLVCCGLQIRVSLKDCITNNCYMFIQYCWLTRVKNESWNSYKKCIDSQVLWMLVFFFFFQPNIIKMDIFVFQYVVASKFYDNC